MYDRTYAIIYFWMYVLWYFTLSPDDFVCPWPWRIARMPVVWLHYFCEEIMKCSADHVFFSDSSCDFYSFEEFCASPALVRKVPRETFVMIRNTKICWPELVHHERNSLIRFLMRLEHEISHPPWIALTTRERYGSVGESECIENFRRNHEKLFIWIFSSIY